MVSVSFFKAKNGSLTCSIQNCMLHSAYDPEKEAQRFTSEIFTEFPPSIIIITGPGLPYLVALLRTKYPKSFIGAIQYDNAFSSYDSNWDCVLYPDNINKLYSIVDEENITSTLFISWKPSETSYPQQYAQTWHYIKNHISFCRDILGTRSYFGPRWLKNSLNFYQSARHFSYPIKTDIPAVITASGPSLSKSFTELKKYRSRFFLIAVSSSLTALLEEEIIPDVVISTDGGYWAKKHLVSLCKYNKNANKLIPLAVSPESAVPSELYSSAPIIPLFYGDGLDTVLFNTLNITPVHALRNGTVSGTAVSLALNLTTGPVCICGLDLQESKGLQHTKPNELEITASCCDTRLSNAATRAFSAEFNSNQLSIYRTWFSEHAESFSHRLFRIENYAGEFRSSLGSIPQCTLSDFFIESSPSNITSGLLYTTKTFVSNKEETLTYLDTYIQALNSCDEMAITNETAMFSKYICFNDFVLFKKEKTKERFLLLKNKITHFLKSYINRTRIIK